MHHLWFLFRNVITQKAPTFHLSNAKSRSRTKVTFSIKFWTASLLCFNIFASTLTNGFYDSNKKKKVPEDIFNIFTSVSLAYWFMDDSFMEKTSFVLCTDSFSINDVNRLRTMLKMKFGLENSLFITTNKFPRIRILSASHTLFIKTIEPYLLPCFYYKIYKYINI